MYIYIAHCQVVVKFYRDLYFLYRPANVPASRVSWNWTDKDFKILLWKYNSRTNKTIKISAATAIAK